MHLIIDQGNTFAKVYIFDDEKIVARARFEQLDVFLIDKICKEYPISHSICSAVAELDHEVIAFLQTHTNYLPFDHQTPLPFINNYQSKESLGLDRIAAVAAAHHSYPHQNNLVIDLGTCITFDFVDHQGAYWGGAISPGLHMRLNAMHTFTSKLPLADLHTSKINFVGDTTIHSIQSGAYWGVYHEIQGRISQYQEKYGQINVLLCGGDLVMFDTLLKNSIFARQDLVAEGLHTILVYNEKK